MLDDLTGAYNALRMGQAPRLPMVRLQYPDFAAWQFQRLQSSTVQRQVLPILHAEGRISVPCTLWLTSSDSSKF